jgi:hydrogenase expression/formation protein HypD
VIRLKELASFRSSKFVQKVSDHLRKHAPKEPITFCHVCGTHEWTITHYGLRALLPQTIEVIAGPGCPVCILPAAEIDEAVKLALEGVTLVTFGDLLRVPGSQSSLAQAKAEGGDIRVVYGVGDAVQLAKNEPEKEFAFFAIGFETTAPTTANEILISPPENLSFLVSHRLIPPAMELLLGIGDLHIDGFIAPGHVSAIIGLTPYEVFPTAYHMPVVVAGFEPLDLLLSISLLINQVRDGVAKLDNEYSRVVTQNGNLKALSLLNQVFDVEEGRWRGLGRLPFSAYVLKAGFKKWDAREKHGVRIEGGRDITPGCLCHLIMIGKIKPVECPLFNDVCTPDSPKGACMVSMEGTCRIWAKYALQM